MLRFGVIAAGVAAAGWMAPSLDAQGRGGGAGQPTTAQLAAMPTPKMADGHPDLNGRWGGGGGGNAATQRFDAQGNYHNVRNYWKEKPGQPGA